MTKEEKCEGFPVDGHIRGTDCAHGWTLWKHYNHDVPLDNAPASPSDLAAAGYVPTPAPGKGEAVGQVCVVFDGPPGPVSGRFVEVEIDGRSISAGEWVEKGGLWELRLRRDLFSAPAPSGARIAELERDLAAADERISELSAMAERYACERDTARSQLADITRQRDWFQSMIEKIGKATGSTFDPPHYVGDPDVVLSAVDGLRDTVDFERSRSDSNARAMAVAQKERDAARDRIRRICSHIAIECGAVRDDAADHEWGGIVERAIEAHNRVCRDLHAARDSAKKWQESTDTARRDAEAGRAEAAKGCWTCDGCTLTECVGRSGNIRCGQYRAPTPAPAQERTCETEQPHPAPAAAEEARQRVLEAARKWHAARETWRKGPPNSESLEHACGPETFALDEAVRALDGKVGG